MKRKIFILIIPLICCLFSIFGCGEKHTANDVKLLYEKMRQVCVIEEENKFFDGGTNSNLLKIKYSPEVQSAIDDEEVSTDLQKRYVALGLQQKILDRIFNYYESNQEDFYRVLSNNQYDQKELDNLYKSLEQLYSALEDFKVSYVNFCDATAEGISDVMEFSLTNYSFELNKVITKSFNFIDNFIGMHTKYCNSEPNAITATNIQLKIEKAYVDIARVVYLENINAFNFPVGNRGKCDLVGILDSENPYSLISNMLEIKDISTLISANLPEGTTSHEATIYMVNNFLYSQEVFEQKLNSYISVYNNSDVYSIAQYKFNQVVGVTYDSYLSSLNSTTRANAIMMTDFIENNYKQLVQTLKLITA